jgi:transmembrane sensor
MKKEINERLIARYVMGQCSDREEKKVRSWMNENPDQKIVVQNLRKKWKSGATRLHTFDVEAAWEELTEKMDRGEAARIIHSLSDTGPSGGGKAKRRHPPVMNQFLRAAAAVLIIGFAALYFFRDNGETEQFTMEEVVTERGQRANIQLDDGSRVRLSVDSNLAYPGRFAADSRTVHLTGVPFF